MDCDRCGKQISDVAGNVCLACGWRFEVVPWEHPEVGHWLVRWWRTCLMGMRTPAALFRALRPMGRLGPAMAFFALCAVVQGVGGPVVTSLVGGRFLQELVGSPVLSPVLNGLLSGQSVSPLDQFPTGRPAQARPDRAAPRPTPKPALDLTAVMTGVSVGSSLFLVASAFIALFAMAGVFQLGAWLFVPNRRSFADTLTATAYAHTPVLCTLVPVIGGLVFMFWMTFLLVIGLREVHQTTRRRVVLALTVIPMLALVGLGGFAFAAITQLTSALSR